MKILRWIIGLIFPFVLTIGLLYLFSSVVEDGMTKATFKISTLYDVIHCAELVILFFSFVFSSSLFVPAPKKYAVVLTVCLSLVAFGIILYSIYKRGVFLHFRAILLLNFGCVFAGIALGVIGSITLFKNRGWDMPKPVVDHEIAEQY